MKKHLLWISPIVVLVFILVLYTQSYVYTFYFYLRHILIYGLFAYLLVLGLLQSFRRINERYKMKRRMLIFLIILNSLAGIILLVSASEYQILWIEEYEEPILQSCEYYDPYGNLLYQSQYPNSCATMLNYEESVIEGRKTITYQMVENYSTSYSGEENSPYAEATLVTDFEFIYDSLSSIDKSLLYELTIVSKETRHLYEDDGDKTEGNYYYKHIDYQYETLSTTIIISKYADTLREDGITTISFPEVHDLDLETVTLESVLTPSESEWNYSDNQMNIYKTYTDNQNIEQTDLYLNGEYRTQTSPFISLHFYEDNLYTGNDLNAFFLGDTYTLYNQYEDNSFVGAENYYDSTSLTYETFPLGCSIDGHEIFCELDEFRYLKILTLYSEKSNSTSSSGETIKGDYFIKNEFVYVEKGHQLSKVSYQEYGFLSENYTTRRYGFDSEEVTYLLYRYFLLNNQIGMGLNTNNIEDFYDYEAMLVNPGELQNYVIYQSNPLLEVILIK